MSVDAISRTSGYRRQTNVEFCVCVVIPKVVKLVAAFFAWLAKAIYQGIAWVVRKICNITYGVSFIGTGPFVPKNHALSAAQDRAAALERLQEIQTRLNLKTILFRIPDEILHFDFDAALAPYSKDKDILQLKDLYDYAGRDFLDPLETDETYRNRKERLTEILREYSGYRPVGHNLIAKQSLSQLYDILASKKVQVEAGTYDEDELKNEIRLSLAAVINAHINCIDQVNGQLENILLDVIVTELEETEHSSKAQILASHALFKYRSNIVSEICNSYHPNFAHMADLERAIKQRIAAEVGIESDVTARGACFERMAGDIEEAVRWVKPEFFNIYNNRPEVDGPDRRPLAYLQRELQTYHGHAALRNLRGEILKTVMEGYDLSNAYNDEFEVPDKTAADLIKQASKEGEDGFIDGQSWSLAGTLWFMEQAGLIREVT